MFLQAGLPVRRAKITGPRLARFRLRLFASEINGIVCHVHNNEKPSRNQPLRPALSEIGSTGDKWARQGKWRRIKESCNYSHVFLFDSKTERVRSGWRFGSCCGWEGEWDYGAGERVKGEGDSCAKLYSFT